MTRKHSSRMCTARLLTVSYSNPCIGGGGVPPGHTHSGERMSSRPWTYPLDNWINTLHRGPCTRDTHPSAERTWGQRYSPPVNRHATCVNITFPRFRFRVVNITFPKLSFPAVTSLKTSFHLNRKENRNAIKR